MGKSILPRGKKRTAGLIGKSGPPGNMNAFNHGGGNVKLSIKSLAIAAAILGALCFLFISLLNLILPPYGGAFLALLTSLYLGYDPMVRPISLIIGTVYSLLAGALAGALFGWLYNSFVERS